MTRPALLSALLTFSLCSLGAAQISTTPDATPATIPAPEPAPAQAAPAKPTFTFGSPPRLQVTTTLVSVTRPEGVTLWGSLGSEMLLLPGLGVSLSAPLQQTPTYRLLARANAELYLVASTSLGADLLLTNGNGHFYGGPSAALVLGGDGGWLAGGVLGYRNATNLADGRFGYFVEAKVRYLNLKNAVGPSFPGGTVSDFRFVSPGLKLGVTYNF